MMLSLITPASAKTALARNLKERRLARDLTQVGLSEQSGVALATLRKFEQTGAISIDNLFKLMLVVGGLEKIIEASAPEPHSFSSIDEVMAGKKRRKRQRGSRS
jgi:transcriptional regulator with XRE-family HTH domain